MPTSTKILFSLLLACISQTSWGANYDFLPDTPQSDFAQTLPGEPSLEFCYEWNPDFSFMVNRCCTQPVAVPRKKRRKANCANKRVKFSFCDEMTPEQREYTEAVSSGKVNDVLVLVREEMKQNREQAFCSPNNGFLAHGRRLVPTLKNRVAIRSPQRCVDFGTDGMVGMLEWVGRQIDQEYPRSDYPGLSFVIGDISAPKGGCLSGRSGRKGHSSHTSGQDVDIGYLYAQKHKSSPISFHQSFDPKTNWWLIQQIFKNPYVCVKRIFLDRKWIGKLSKVAAGDPLWIKYRHLIQHVRGHRNHIHVRVGRFPGEPGCLKDIFTDDEIDEGDEPSAESPDEGTDSGEFEVPMLESPSAPSGPVLEERR